MLIRFSVQNFRSIREKQTFSLEQNTSITDDLAPLINNDDGLPNLLRAAAIYGLNASGKSNFLRAAFTMRAFVLASAKDMTKKDEIFVFPFLLDRESKHNPTRFEIEFIVDGVRYEFSYEATDKRIIKESLDAYPKKLKQNWYTRELVNSETGEYKWNFGTNFKGEKETIKNSTRSNALFLSTGVLLNNEMLRKPYQFFSEKFFISPNNLIDMGYTDDFIKKTPNGRERVLEFILSVDQEKRSIGIEDFNLKYQHFEEDKISAFLETLPKEMPAEEKENIRQTLLNDEILNIKSVHRNPETGDSVEFPLEYESVGTRKLLGFAGLWLEALDKGQVLFIDEIENSFHCRITGYLIKLFNNPTTNPNNAQLVFSTHSSVALKANEFRRDQIWFTNKSRETFETILYPLTKVKVRRDEDKEAGFLSGKYSDIPDIDPAYILK